MYEPLWLFHLQEDDDCQKLFDLTRCGLMTPYGDIDPGQRYLR